MVVEKIHPILQTQAEGDSDPFGYAHSRIPDAEVSWFQHLR